jgi:hypothetical protein
MPRLEMPIYGYAVTRPTDIHTRRTNVFDARKGLVGPQAQQGPRQFIVIDIETASSK